MIHICILTHNRLEKVQRCIESVMPTVRNGGLGLRLNVLDQGSTDGTKEWLQSYFSGEARTSFRSSWQNLRAIGGRQRQVDMLIGDGLLYSDVIVFLDSDVIVTDPRWLMQLTNPLMFSRVGISGAYGRNISKEWELEEPEKLPGEVDVVGGGMTAIRAEVFLSGCEFDQAYLPFWHCDSDLCLQVKDRGWKVWCTGEIGLVHDAEHKTVDAQYLKNWARLREKWAGRVVLSHTMGVFRDHVR